MKNKTPQLEDGFIQIATGKEQNDVFMALIKQRLNGTQYQIILLTIRKTWGYKKKDDWISLTQFENYLSKSRWSICKEIKKLVNNNILVKFSIPGVSATYSINKEFNTWKILVNKSRLVNKTHPTSQQNAPQLVNKSRPTKETITKETITKERNSKNSLIPCTETEIQQISIDLNMPISRVQLKHETILDKIAAGEYKYKTVYRTLREWLRRDKEKLLPIIAKTPEEIEEDKILNAPYPPGALDWKRGIKI